MVSRSSQYISAIMISNHGGRQLDTSISTLEALLVISSTLQQYGHKIEIILDGGIYNGSSMLKCLALGATAVAIGTTISCIQHY